MNTNITPREQEVLRLALHGFTDAETAHRLGIAPGSVTTYWERMRKKLGAKNRMHVAGIVSGVADKV